MRGKRWLAFAGATAGVLSWALVADRSEASSASEHAEAVLAREREIHTRDILLFESRVKDDPYSAADFARLAALYLQHGREAGAFDDYGRAEHAARESLRLRAERNASAALILASSLLAQHQFTEARKAAEALVEMEPDKPSHQALLGEIQMELGDYGAARRTFAGLGKHSENLAVAPRLARWEEVQGRNWEARRYFYDALRTARARADLPREQVAWFHLRAGDFDLRHGDLENAERTLQRGLEVAPDDGRLWSALARVSALRRDWRRVVLQVRNAGDAADIATLALAGDAFAALGERDSAAAYFDRADASYADNPEPFARQWTTFRLDHNRDLQGTLTLLEEEIQTRPDVLGWNLLSWAYYRNGRYEEAAAASERALSQGTQDAQFFAHAAAIHAALGDSDRARALERRARTANRYVAANLARAEDMARP